MKTNKFFKAVLRYIETTNDKMVDLEELCFDLLKKEGFSDLEILEKIGKILPNIRKKLQEYHNSLISKGLVPPFEFNEFDEYKLIIPKKKKDFILVKKRITEELKTLDWETFQKICKKLLEMCGCQKVSTLLRKDGGVDVFGIMIFPKNSTYFRIIRGLRIIGQAKHVEHQRKISENEIRTFLSQIDDLKKGRGRGYEKLPEWFKKKAYPWHFIFITNGSYTRGAKEVAEKENLTLIEGDELAEEIVKYYSSFQKFLKELS